MVRFISRILKSSLLIFTMGCATVSHASLTPTDLMARFNNQVSISANAMYLDYKESENGETLDSVKGTAPGVELRFRKSFNRVFVEPSLSFYSGRLNYDGGYFDSSDVFHSLSTKSKNMFIKPELMLGVSFEISPDIEIAPLIVYGYQRWDREVPPVGTLTVDGETVGINSYTEEYTHYYLAAGAELKIIPRKNLVLALKGWGGSTIQPRLFTNAPYGGGDVGIDYTLGQKGIYNIDLKADYAVEDNLHLFAEFGFLYYEYGKSSTVVGTLEPDSSTRQYITKLGIAFDLA